MKPIAFLLALVLLFSLTAPAAAAESAATIRLSKTTGTVAVSKSSGKKLTQIANMRLYNGYHVATEETSYAWINLDDAKLIKEDAASEVEVRKDGKKLEVNACSGNLFFNVTEDLKEDETLNISTSTMVVGIRGTSGWLRVRDEWSAELFVLEGVVSCSVTDPVTGQVKTEQVRGGESVTCVVYPQDQTGDKCDIVRRKYTEGDIPGFVLTELVWDVPLCEEIEEETGLDILKDLAKDGGGDPSGKTGTAPGGKTATPQAVQEAQRRQDGDEQELKKKIDGIEEQERRQPHTISPDKAFPKKQTSGTKNPAIDGGSGSSGGSSSSSRPKPRTMKLKDVEVQALLEGRSSLTVQPNTDAADTTPKKNILEVDTGLTVTAGKTVDLQSGIDVEVYPGKRLQVDGTLRADDLQNNGTVDVTSGETLRLRGDMSNAGTLRVSATGRVVVDGVFSRSGPADLAQGARVQAKRFAAGAAPSGWAVSAGADAQGYYSLVPQEVPPVTYTVTFQANGGAFAGGGTQKTAQTSANGTAAFPANPVRENYIFAGWFTAEEGGTQVTASQVFQANTTIYARWTEKAVWTVTFDANGGAFADGAAQKAVQTGENGTAAFPADPVRENFAFTGWFTAAEGGTQVTASQVFQANATVYAQWKERVRYTVTFQANGGAFAGGEAQKTAQTDLETGLAVFPADPARENFVFSGWYDAPENGARVTAADAFTQDTTLYAHWAQNVYTITFNAGDGAFADGSKEKTVPTGDDGTAPPPGSPTRTGNYRFAGWFTASSGGTKVEASQVFTEDTVVYAQWTEAFEITFHSAGGTYADGTTGMKNVMTNPDGTVDFPEISFTNYRLLGWSTQTAGGELIPESYVFTKHVSLVAQWEGAAVITFDVNGGAFADGSASRTTTTDGQWHVNLPTEEPVREGYVFEGWCTSKAGGTPVTGAAQFYKATTLYASWIKAPVITFDASGGAFAGGEAQKTVTAAVDGTFTLPTEEPAREGYVFDGWYTAASGGTAVTSASKFTSDTTVYAHWKEGVSVTFNAGDGAFSDGTAVKSAAVNADGTVTFPADPSRTDYRFEGWYTAAEGGTKVEQTQTFAVSTTVYAHWASTAFAWKYDAGTKTLTFSGEAAMPDYAYNAALPWSAHIVEVENVVIQEGITNVGSYAFRNCANLKNVSIPSSAGKIGESAFEGCSSLTDVQLPDTVTAIGRSAFSECTSLAGITLPKNLTSIGNSAFSKCSSLSSIEIPSGVGKLPYGTFSECSALTRAALPEGLTEIGSMAFYNCSNLTSVNIPSTVTRIASNAFENCGKWAGPVTIPSGVTAIENGVFKKCAALTGVTIPNSVSSIGKEAFRGCSSLQTATIPSSVNSIGEYAFAGCSSLTTPIVIPSGVTRIEQYTFNGCSSVTDITIPNGVSSIGNDAFARCTSITSLTIPDSVTTISAGAFFGDSKLSSITLSKNLQAIEVDTFRSCAQLQSLTIPDNVTRIENYAFSASGLTVLRIPDSVVSMGTNVFNVCKSLTDITLSANLAEIPEGTFMGCESLTSLVIPDKVTAIKSTAINCAKLTELTVPASVTSISSDAIYYTTPISTINFKGTLAQWQAVNYTPSYVFTNVTVKCSDGDTSL